MFNRTSLHIAMLLWGFIFSLIAAACMFMSKNFEKNKRKWLLGQQLCCAVLLLSDAFAWGFRGTPGTVGYEMVFVSNFLVFFTSDLLLFLFHGYTCCHLFGDSRLKEEKCVHTDKLIFAVYGIAIVGMVMVMCSQFTHWYYYIDGNNLYHRGRWHFVSMIWPMLGMILDLKLIYTYRKNVKKEVLMSLVSYIVLPFLASAVQVFYYGISLVNIAISISMILMFVVAVMEQNQNLASKEKEAAELRISMMLSQIAPHFIYNTLTTIRSLCETNPKMAAETVEQFAMYLRGNLDSLGEKISVPFKQELEHIQCYAAIEKKRFGSRVNIEYDIREEDFMIPALTVQPLVENAVKHGLCKKEEGGTVTIATNKDEKGIHIFVIDDGAGFDETEGMSKDRNHVGWSNVRSRLQEMCQGTLKVKSRLGEGTTAEITLPFYKER